MAISGYFSGFVKVFVDGHLHLHNSALGCFDNVCNIYFALKYGEKPLQFMKELYLDELVSTPIMSQINKKPNLR